MDDSWDDRRERIIGFGEHSGRKSYYPELQQRLKELEQAQTALSETNRQLRENQELLGTIIDSLPSPVFYKDENGVYLGCNEAFCAFIGIPKERVIGATAYDLAPKELADLYHNSDRQLLAQKGTQTYEAEIRGADDAPHNVVFYKSIILREDGTIRGIVGIMLDITERKRSEEEREILNQRLLHMEKIESIGRLAGGVAHDFNNLLTPIMVYAEMLRRSMAADERALRKIDSILEASGKARDLTRQLLAFGRKQIMELKIITLNQVIESLFSILKRTIREDVAITLKLDPELGSISADQLQIEQILMNLAINAQDAMPGGGVLIIETANCSQKEAPREDPDLRPGEYVKLTVSDTGCGMDPDTMAHIFEPFYTTKEQGKGTGLGLATVFGIVKQHGGHIHVYSEPGHGSSFGIYLPRLDAPPTEPEAPSADEAPPRMQNLTILLVEDDAMVRNMTRELLTEQGYAVLAADGAEQAIELLRGHERPVDLLLSDVIMPVMSGPALYEALTSIQPDLRVLYMSGYTENVVAYHGLPDQSVNYIQKPFSTMALMKKMDEAMSRPGTAG